MGVGVEMAEIGKILKGFQGKKCAVYGLGTETGRFLREYGEGLSVVGLLDGFREEGKMYGFPIIPVRDAVGQGAAFIVVVARPGSCKAIAKRVGRICKDNGIALFDVRGRDLLAERAVSYGFGRFDGMGRAHLLEKIERAGLVSFDLFDTLVMRKTLCYTDIFELLERRLAGQGIFIPDFAKLRLSSEKELAYAPGLAAIYEEVLRRAGGSFLTAGELAWMEWEQDFSLMVPRASVCDIFREAVRGGKRVVITTDSYYSREQIRQILALCRLDGFEEALISCERGISKASGLYQPLLDMNEGRAGGILHIGDDEAADMEGAGNYGMDTYRIHSGSDLFDMLGGLGMEKEMETLADRVKAGLLIAKLLNDPFVFEEGRKLAISDAFDIGYLFCAPVIADFCLWLRERVRREGIRQILFCARDGFLIGRLFRKIDRDVKTFYFLASRTAAIRAGVRDEEDLSYVDGMKFFGTEGEGLRARFGIEGAGLQGQNGRERAILGRAGHLLENYRKYIEKLGIKTEETAMFDFAAKGTVQMYLGRLFEQHIRGFYFLRLEPEFMADKGLDIESFYSEEEKDASEIFDKYYILETILTSPYPSVVEFDGEGRPVYAPETRNAQDIRCIRRVQEGIEAYFEEYIGILPEPERERNQRLDERCLSLLGKIRIEDERFLGLQVEDPFFGRVTAVSDVMR